MTTATMEHDMFGWSIEFSHTDLYGVSWYIKTCPHCHTQYTVNSPGVYYSYCQMCETKFPLASESETSTQLCGTCVNYDMCSFVLNRRKHEKTCHWTPNRYQAVSDQ